MKRTKEQCLKELKEFKQTHSQYEIDGMIKHFESMNITFKNQDIKEFIEFLKA